MWSSFPIILTSFGFNQIITTLRIYVRTNKRSLLQSIIICSSIPLIAYLL
nr:aromatic amino acid transport family protein [Francisella tularensis]